MDWLKDVVIDLSELKPGAIGEEQSTEDGIVYDESQPDLDAENIEQQEDVTEGDDRNTEEATATTADLFEITVSGEKRQFTLDELKEYASKGIDYTKKTTDVANERKMVLQEKERLAQTEQNWQNMLALMDKNPALYQQVMDASAGKPIAAPHNGNVQDKDNQFDMDNYDPVIKHLKTGYDDMASKLNRIDAAIRQSEQQQRTEHINTVVSDFTSWFNTQTGREMSKEDAQGLADKMQRLRLPVEDPESYRTAFYSQYHEQLVAQAQEKAREEAAKKIVVDNKRGIVKPSNASATTGTQPKNNGIKFGDPDAFEKLRNKILAEYGAT